MRPDFFLLVHLVPWELMNVNHLGGKVFIKIIAVRCQNSLKSLGHGAGLVATSGIGDRAQASDSVLLGCHTALQSPPT